jgi:hypothetical protein
MTKRSAITMAAGLALALLVGVAAISLTLGDGAAANANGHRKPKIEHRVQTVTIHRQAPNTSGPTTRIVQLPSGSASGVATSTTSGGYSESEGFDDSSSEDSGPYGGSSAADEVGDD